MVQVHAGTRAISTAKLSQKNVRRLPRHWKEKKLFCKNYSMFQLFYLFSTAHSKPLLIPLPLELSGKEINLFNSCLTCCTPKNILLYETRSFKFSLPLGFYSLHITYYFLPIPTNYLAGTFTNKFCVWLIVFTYRLVCVFHYIES